MKSKADTMQFLRNVPEDGKLWARVEASLQQIEPPFVKGSPEPAMKKPQEPRWINDKFNPAYLVELRDNYLNYNDSCN